jgi:predicted signal transduction protein with EAL and GGDEF domain
MFEITETVAMQDAQKTIEMIRAFQTSGFEIAIDDFGTGYSSLAYLQRFRVKQLKIDRFFTNGLYEHGAQGRAIVSAIMALALAGNGRGGRARRNGIATRAAGLHELRRVARLPARQARQRGRLRCAAQGAHDGRVSTSAVFRHCCGMRGCAVVSLS